MTLVDVKDYIKTLGIGSYFSVGRIDKSKDESIGIYQRAEYAPARIAIGGPSATKTQVLKVSILVHWNNNAKTTEQNAQALYRALLDASDATIGGVTIDCLIPATAEAVDVGSDENGVYERVIWVDIYYQKEEED